MQASTGRPVDGLADIDGVSGIDVHDLPFSGELADAFPAAQLLVAGHDQRHRGAIEVHAWPQAIAPRDGAPIRVRTITLKT